MRFHADLHVHSKYSRATSRDLDLEHLAWWAARKGIGIVGTGDFVHPQWLAELKSKLVPAEPGLFRLSPEVETVIAATLPPSCRAPVRFLLQVEISTIYKKGDRTRKVHHLLYAPDFATVDRIAEQLARIGNIASDGRPILGLDSRDLLEITLQSSPDAYLVPAHIWTPWFAALGSQSGFDSIGECYGDLADRIFAVETGLSSDPPMNWRVSSLDRFRLTSSSDAHSPGKLGREATCFDCEPDYFAIRRALERGEGYVGTVEFFPDEGKYHLDGHRKCRVRLTPAETLAHDGRCPVCGDRVTVGVEHRVELLADRREPVSPPTAGVPRNLVPLPEVLAEIAGSGPATKTVERGYDRVLAALGPELFVLDQAPVEDIARAGSSLLAEAVTRLRAGRVIREAGYDGEYGVIRLFEDSELKRLTGGELLFEAPRVTAIARRAAPKREPATAVAAEPAAASRGPDVAIGVLAGLDDRQRAAAEHAEGALLIIAGPGSGKTRTLTHRIAHLIVDRGVPAERCLAITFTRRAATELRERLAVLLASRSGEVAVHTFHSLGLSILRRHAERAGLRPGFRIAADAERVALLAETRAISERRAERLLQALSTLRRTGAPPEQELASAMQAYRDAMAMRNWIDFDDLVGRSVDLLEADPAVAQVCGNEYRFISVDEFQDVDATQYRLLRLLAPHGNLCVIGDPDQAIYGFRGADARVLERFRLDYPEASTIRLARNYRSTGTIVRASSRIIRSASEDSGLAAIVREMHERITVHAAPTEAAEAEFVVQAIEGLIGGHNFFSIDSGRAGLGSTELSFADFAVLYRTEAQSAALHEALTRSGIPFKTSSPSRLADNPAVMALLRELDGAAPDAPVPSLLGAAAACLEGRDEIDPASLREVLRRLTSLAASGHGDRASFLEAVALSREWDVFDPRADRVSLMTMHAAKGLEFPVVFLVGLEDGLMPLRFGAAGAAEAEERRLLYVAMTRAKDRLYLSRAQSRLWRGRLGRPEPSPFLADIEAELLRLHRGELPRRRAQNRQLELF